MPEGKLMQRMRGENNAANPNAKALVKCFPLHSILSAIGNPLIDLFSIDIEGIYCCGIKPLIAIKKLEVFTD
jgi:hypothetical protein